MLDWRPWWIYILLVTWNISLQALTFVTTFIEIRSLHFTSSGSSLFACTRLCHSRTETIPSPTAAAPIPRFGIKTRRRMPACTSSAISRSTRVDDLLNASMCAIVTNGGSLRLKFSTSAMRVEFIPAFSGMLLNMLLRIYSMYWGTSRRLRSLANEAITPVSSSWSSSCEVEAEDGKERRFGIAVDGDEFLRFSPNAATALLRLGFVIRDECAGVAWRDMALYFVLFLSFAQRGRVSGLAGGKNVVLAEGVS
jgi:hypothetical protein